MGFFEEFERKERESRADAKIKQMQEEFRDEGVFLE